MTDRPTLYEILAADPASSLDELRAAYRREARRSHPDVAGTSGTRRMSEVNEAWRVLSDPGRRRAYDASLPRPTPSGSPGAPPTPGPAPGTARSRRDAWVRGVQAQIARLASLAGRSAVQTVLLRHPGRPRSVLEGDAADIVAGLLDDTERRIRAARACGVAPLDLGVGTTLVGIRLLAADLADRARRGPVTDEMLRSAELLDRMWEVLAHELPLPLTERLGGSPRIHRHLRSTP